MPRTIAALLLTVFFPLAHAATFTVSNLNDSGSGSLRDAMAQANANPDSDTIKFSVTGTIVLTSGQLAINGPLTIEGPGASALTIDGNDASRIFSIFENVVDVCVTPGTDFPVSISGLTLTNARRTSDASGGAIYSEKTLALTSVVILNSQAKNGGGVSYQTRYPGQSLTITNTQFTNNVARPFASSTSGTNGGGLFVGERCATTANAGPVTIARSVFSGNHTQPTVFLSSSGAGIFVNSFVDVMISDTRITGNSIDPPNPAVAGANYRGAGLSIQGAKSATVERSEISGNSSDRNGGIRLSQDLGTLMSAKIINSTISGNVAVIPPAGASASLGVSGNVAMQLYNSTLANNVALFGSAVGVNLAASSGFTPSLTLQSTILSNPALAADIGLDPTVSLVTVTANQSLVRTTGSGVTVAGSGNVLAFDPMLGPLAFNSATTRTHALLTGSPAIDGGSDPLNLVTDQRGTAFPRVVGGKADMGAFEYSPVAGPSSYSLEYVQKAYVAYYGRPADPAGLDYWAARMDASGGTLDAIIAAFGTSAEFTQRYGGLSNAELVTTIYRQALSRDPDPAGLDFYVNALATGQKTLQTITLDVINGAVGPVDSATVASKLDVAGYYTSRVLGGCPYGTAQDGVNALSGVTGNPLTAAIAKVAIGSRCAP